jgi:hypothetical protein
LALLKEIEGKKLKGSGKDAARHSTKYISPAAISENIARPSDITSKLSIAKDIKDSTGKVIALSGSKIIPIKDSTRIIDGIHHTDFFVVQNNIIKLTIPHNNVGLESEKSGKHVDEYAVIRIWNHFSGQSSDIQEMHNEIERSKTDASHNLHISKVTKNEFVHSVNGYEDNGSDDVRIRAETSYYTNLKNATYAVYAMSKHKDFKVHWKNRDILDSAGRTLPELSDLYKSVGVKGAGATSKADIITIRDRGEKYQALKLISLKDEKGSQLMSSSPAEFEGIYKTALKNIGVTDADTKTIELIRKHLENGNYQDANTMILQLHKKLDKSSLVFTRAIHHEAISGEGNFATQEGTATHIVTIGKNANVYGIDEFLDEHHSYMRIPRATKGKHGEGSTAVRLDTPKKPVKK